MKDFPLGKTFNIKLETNNKKIWINIKINWINKFRKITQMNKKKPAELIKANKQFFCEVKKKHLDFKLKITKNNCLFLKLN